jgi:membrane protein implicated in regulation of membrane protease activity
MDWFFELDKSTLWFLGCLVAIVAEVLIPSFIFLSLAGALLIMSIVQMFFDPPMEYMIGFLGGFWIGSSIWLRYMFGNWGEQDAAEDPNQYDREKAGKKSEE